MEYYMDEKWKLSNEDPNNHSYNSSSKSSLRRSYSQHCPTSSDPPLPRSFSQKTSSSSKSRLSKSSSQRSTNFKSKVKEQKAKFYIVKRCIAMLVRWNKHDKHRDS
ncbi:small polypeptide DEVIL 9 [Lycium ferocissimum]|uniref:small polypeptide DEVIL 9 n=1 Tax=Lycium ferocissimum TaxID=112874 RepID=UPI0028157A6B|nr:small polypeptide DEVIL 9 [Lycium ferocissimum]